MTSPVTEQEMNEINGFFSNIATKLVGLSDQVRELYQLKEDFQRMREHLDVLEKQNADLRDHNTYLENDLHETRNKLDAAQHDSFNANNAANEAAQREQVERARADQANAELEALRNLVIARDARVAELEASNERLATHNRDYENRHNEDVTEIDSLREQISSHITTIGQLNEDVDNARRSREDAEHERDDVKEKLDRIQTFLDQIFPSRNGQFPHLTAVSG